MKHYTSRFLKSLAIFLIGFPVTYLILAATLFNIPMTKCVGILLSPFYYMVSVCAVIAGYGLWEMQRWSWYVFVMAQILIGYENAVLLHGYAESYHKVLVFVAGIVLQIGLVFRVGREVRVPYFFPRIRWWESNPRYRLSVPVSIDRKSGVKENGEILDLSLTGCFIKFRPDLVPDESLIIRFSLYGYEIECEGKVVWCAQSTVTHPKGVGVKFDLIPRQQRRSLRYIVRRLKKIATLYRSSRYLVSQEEYLKQLKDIEMEVDQNRLRTK